MPLRRNNIEAERGRLGLTKSEMCNALGVTTKTYNSYISGGSIPSRVLEILRSMTGKSLDYLLGLSEN
jgi:DNA-binding XRE family transcriptional regulator